MAMTGSHSDENSSTTASLANPSNGSSVPRVEFENPEKIRLRKSIFDEVFFVLAVSMVWKTGSHGNRLSCGENASKNCRSLVPGEKPCLG